MASTDRRHSEHHEEISLTHKQAFSAKIPRYHGDRHEYSDETDS